MAAWAAEHGVVHAFGIEGAGSYGAGLTLALIAMGLRVIEVGRVARQLRRRDGKTGTVDAESAARAVLADDADGEPEVGDVTVEMIRHLKIARDTAATGLTRSRRRRTSVSMFASESYWVHRDQCGRDRRNMHHRNRRIRRAGRVPAWHDVAWHGPAPPGGRLSLEPRPFDPAWSRIPRCRRHHQHSRDRADAEQPGGPHRDRTYRDFSQLLARGRDRRSVAMAKNA